MIITKLRLGGKALRYYMYMYYIFFFFFWVHLPPSILKILAGLN